MQDNLQNSTTKTSKFALFIKEAYRRLKNANVKGRSSELAYSFLMASIPLMLVFIQVASLILSYPENILFTLASTLPESVTNILDNIIYTLASNVSSTSIGLGVIVSIWLGSNGINTLIKHFNRSLNFTNKTNTVLQRLIAMIYTVVFLIVIISSLLFVVFYNTFLNLILSFLPAKNLLGPFWESLGTSSRHILVPLIFLSVFILFYKSAPHATGNSITWKEACIGGFFASFGVSATTFIYTFIIDNISRLSLYFGSLTGILALLTWLLFICLILVSGAEILSAFHAVYVNEEIKKDKTDKENKQNEQS